MKYGISLTSKENHEYSLIWNKYVTPIQSCLLFMACKMEIKEPSIEKILNMDDRTENM